MDETNALLPIDISLAVDDFITISGPCSTTNLTGQSREKEKYLYEILNNIDNSSEYLTSCANSNDLTRSGGVRRAIRIKNGGHNSTAVELLGSDLLQDNEEYPCS